MTRRAKIAIAICALAALQVLAILVYRSVQRSRAAPPGASRFAAERLGGLEPAPPLTGKRADGLPVSIRWPSSRISIVHFWATWCEPCRDELPGLLALSRDLRAHDIDIVAVAVSDQWTAIRAFFGGVVPPEVVVLDDPAAHKRYGTSTLPDTYVVDRAGRLVERYHGARDWRSAAARDHLLTLVR